MGAAVGGKKFCRPPYRGGKKVGTEKFCADKFRGGKIWWKSLKWPGKIWWVFFLKAGCMPGEWSLGGGAEMLWMIRKGLFIKCQKTLVIGQVEARMARRSVLLLFGWHGGHRARQHEIHSLTPCAAGAEEKI